MLTIDQVAERLNVSARTVRRLCQTGQLAHCRIGTGRGVIRVRPSEVDRLLSHSETSSMPTPTTDYLV